MSASTANWIRCSADDCAASSPAAVDANDGDVAKPTTSGPMPTSTNMNSSHWNEPILPISTPTQEPDDRRAVCGKTARTVRREGRPVRVVSTPIQEEASWSSPRHRYWEITLLPFLSRTALGVSPLVAYLSALFICVPITISTNKMGPYANEPPHKRVNRHLQ